VEAYPVGQDRASTDSQPRAHSYQLHAAVHWVVLSDDRAPNLLLDYGQHADILLVSPTESACRARETEYRYTGPWFWHMECTIATCVTS